MLVSIEDTPHLIVRTATPARRIPGFSSLGLDGPVHERKRRAVEAIDSDQHGIAVGAPPVDEVAILGSLALGENEQLALRLSNPSAAEFSPGDPGGQLSPAVIRDAAATNSSCERMGVAPYRPAR